MKTDFVEILLVEDNPDHVELTLNALGEYHVANHIRVARDGAEAIDFLCIREIHRRDVQDRSLLALAQRTGSCLLTL